MWTRADRSPGVFPLAICARSATITECNSKAGSGELKDLSGGLLSAAKPGVNFLSGRYARQVPRVVTILSAVTTCAKLLQCIDAQRCEGFDSKELFIFDARKSIHDDPIRGRKEFARDCGI